MLTSTQVTSPVETANSPYVLLLDAFASVERYPRASDRAAFTELLVKLAVHAKYGTFHALSDVVRAHVIAGSSASAVDDDRVVQVVTRLAVAALQITQTYEQPNDTDDITHRGVTRVFASEWLLTPTAVASSVGVRERVTT